MPMRRLMRKGKEAKLVFMAYALIDNRHELVSDFRLTEANEMAEKDAALAILMRKHGSRRLKVRADRGYDTKDFVAECRETQHHAPRVAEEEMVWD